MWPSTFDLEIIHPSSRRAVAGTILSNSRYLTNETTQTTFKRTKKIPAHHLFFAVWNYDVRSSEPFYDVWRRPNVAAKDLDLFVEYAKKSFDFMMNATKNRNPVLPIMNLVAYSESDLRGWYSWVGATLLSESRVVFREEESTISDRYAMISSVAQSVVAQWVGVLVYPKSLNHLWIYEALTIYIADLVIDKIEPKWRSCDRRLAERILWSVIDGEYPSSPSMRLLPFDIWNNRTYVWKDRLIVRQATLVLRLIHEIHEYFEIEAKLKKFLEHRNILGLIKNTEQAQTYWSTVTKIGTRPWCATIG